MGVELAILHVDDQAVIRDVVRRALEAYGFTVVSVDGVRAAKAALAERDDLAGVLLDIRLRDGSGVDLYDWIAAHRPRLAARVAFVTGSTDRALLGRLEGRRCPIIEKPFELAELARYAAEWENVAQAQDAYPEVPPQRDRFGDAPPFRAPGS